MYYKKKIENNPLAVELIHQREALKEQIRDLQTDLWKLENQIVDTVDAFKGNEVIRDTATGKEYVVLRKGKVLSCNEQEVSISYTIYPIKKDGNVSKNECHEQIGERVERTGKTI